MYTVYDKLLHFLKKNITKFHDTNLKTKTVIHEALDSITAENAPEELLSWLQEIQLEVGRWIPLNNCSFWVFFTQTRFGMVWGCLGVDWKTNRQLLVDPYSFRLIWYTDILISKVEGLHRPALEGNLWFTICPFLRELFFKHVLIPTRYVAAKIVRQEIPRKDFSIKN